MRKPRDIDAELRALTARAKSLKTRKIAQLGELVIATGAEALEPEVLAGALLAALETKAADTREAWRKRGAAFFRQQISPASKPAGDASGGTPGAGGGQ